MRYHLECPFCNQEDFQRFTVEVSPNNDGIYEVKCPKGHVFKMDVLLHHFQVLFENAIHSLSDKYYIESFVSFATCYERFIEYFLNVVLVSRGINKSDFQDAWKGLASHSERQLGAFILFYLQEFNIQPKLLSSSIVTLRNKVIHKGYLPTENDCIKIGDAVLKFIRPIVGSLKTKKVFHDELIRSINYTGYKNEETRVHSMPYQYFAINRPINNTDEKSVSNFLKDEETIKYRA